MLSARDECVDQADDHLAVFPAELLGPAEPLQERDVLDRRLLRALGAFLSAEQEHRDADLEELGEVDESLDVREKQASLVSRNLSHLDPDPLGELALREEAILADSAQAFSDVPGE